MAMPYRHDPHAFGRLRDRVILAFKPAGSPDDMDEQSWRIFGLGIVQWLGALQMGHYWARKRPASTSSSTSWAGFR
ncbi:hypothetical protein [Streptomyces sp. TRM68416]|uniref:hypothetical protein n=1 Tax=Streptomyces sp. TRM68416 TaxID=2758412 RepID=UPI0016620D1C|nr:hypothetical protein [Streptomyces sp. TRM68416]MBD0843978.1 hypothetical protein [Streptomyces sp. TRM68416]